MVNETTGACEGIQTHDWPTTPESDMLHTESPHSFQKCPYTGWKELNPWKEMLFVIAIATVLYIEDMLIAIQEVLVVFSKKYTTKKW